MDFDFNLVLVPLTLILGLIWLADKLWFKKHRNFKKSVAEYHKADKEYLTNQKKLHDLLNVHSLPTTLADSNLSELSELNTSQQELLAKLTDDELQKVQASSKAFRDSLNKRAQADASVQLNKEPTLINWAYDFFPVLAVVLVVRSFIIEPFNIPSSSMVPTLYTGDFIAVNKSSYGVKLPLTNTKVIDTGSPQHGDVAVFRYPEDPKIYYIKRVIGLPGDSVSYNQGIITINGKAVDTKYSNFIADTELTSQLYPAGEKFMGHILSDSDAKKLGKGEESLAVYFQENQGNHQHLVRYLHDVETGHPQDTWEVTVPDGAYFVMGDNRDRSRDSRSWGFVPEENLAGKAVYVWMHKKPGLSNMPTFSRNRAIE